MRTRRDDQIPPLVDQRIGGHRCRNRQPLRQWSAGALSEPKKGATASERNSDAHKRLPCLGGERRFEPGEGVQDFEACRIGLLVQAGTAGSIQTKMLSAFLISLHDRSAFGWIVPQERAITCHCPEGGRATPNRAGITAPYHKRGRRDQ